MPSQNVRFPVDTDNTNDWHHIQGDVLDCRNVDDDSTIR